MEVFFHKYNQERKKEISKQANKQKNPRLAYLFIDSNIEDGYNN